LPARRDLAAVGDASPECRDTFHHDAAVSGGDRALTGNLDAARNNSAVDQDAIFRCADRAAIDDRTVNCGAAKDTNSRRRAGNEFAIEKPAGQKGAAGYGDATGPDSAGIGHAPTKRGGADHHRVSVSAELGRIRPCESHCAPPSFCLGRPSTAPTLPQSALAYRSYLDAHRERCRAVFWAYAIIEPDQ